MIMSKNDVPTALNPALGISVEERSTKNPYKVDTVDIIIPKIILLTIETVNTRILNSLKSALKYSGADIGFINCMTAIGAINPINEK